MGGIGLSFSKAFANHRSAFAQSEHDQKAHALAEQSTAAERLRGELETRQNAWATAQTKLEQILKDGEVLKTRQAELAAARKSLAGAEESVTTAEKDLLAVRAAIDQRQDDRPSHERRADSLAAALPIGPKNSEARSLAAARSRG